MNQIERVEGHNYELRLWSDAVYEVNTDEIKELAICVADRFDLELRIDGRYSHRRKDWTISFRWRTQNGLGWTGCDRRIELEALSRTYPQIMAGGICYEINQHISQLACSDRIAFTTSPPRLASFERVRQMFADGQVEIPRSGFFDQFLDSLPRIGGTVELPIPRQEDPRPPVTRDLLPGYLLQRYDNISAHGEYEGLGLRACKYNAKSKMLRCAVNPSGPCQSCQHYEKI